MAKELVFLELMRLVLSIQTGIMTLGIFEVFARRPDIHKRIMLGINVSALLLFIFFFGSEWFGWQYNRYISQHVHIILKLGALLVSLSLMATSFLGWLGILKLHRRSLFVTLPLWVSLLVSTWFFY